ncbi:hypothetical protein HYH02_005865 [Chlamydomonas schloesseri]|uniref:Protein kinase domain-containing protein n=1 Tax=Chlamydomonas schloesseri TaxID=2026947 RepID=A0A835WKK3_9CHLO|nr:hypothetical protein HYH02_005865 [Chlamydomonas schloesseri]|eukprot:KAG2449117.1 hypothetical protein HYH02_005865 [Chlamydomonas schloesseri]
MTGLEVSHDFDLQVPYYRRVPWAPCKQLCLDTPGCRSVSFLASEELCTLKTATCVEAGLGSGCLQRHPSTGYFMHADRAGSVTDFVAGTPETSLHYVGLPSQLGSAGEAEAVCRQLGGGGARPASLHTTSDYRTLLRAAEQAAARMENTTRSITSSTGGAARDTGGPYVFWLHGTHNASSGRITWQDGTRYVLPFNFSVEVRGGCAAAVVANGTASLAARACTELGAPVCAVYAPGDAGVRFQTDSTMVVAFNDRLGAQDAVNFCAGMGAVPHRPVGARGREALAELLAFAHGDFWIDGSGPTDVRPAALTNYTFNDGSLIPSEFWGTEAAVGADCILAAAGGKLSGWLYPNTCDEARHVACQWPVRNGPGPLQAIQAAPTPYLPSWEGRTDRLPARVRLHRGGAYVFITNPATYTIGVSMCEALGGSMTSIHDAATDALVSQTWIDLDPVSNNFVLIGERRVLTYIGLDNLRGINLEWKDGTPYDYKGELFTTTSSAVVVCVVVNSVGPTGPIRWDWANWSECQVRRRNITCLVPAKPYVQPSAAVISGSSLFELHLETPRTFPDAQEACQARGGNLASPSLGRDLEALRAFLHRLRQEDSTPPRFTNGLTSDFEVWVGATTNKTDSNLEWTDFFWVDSPRTVIDFPMWYGGYPLGRPVLFPQFAGARSAATMSYANGNMMLVRRRYNVSRPFLCETPLGPTLQSSVAPDGTVYEVLRTPYALPYHAAEQVCQARGGHLAGVSSPQQLGAVAQLCSAALQALPRTASGGFESHDVSDGCWVGLYCPAGYRGDVSFKDGFGERALHKLASFQPSILQGSSCSSASDLVWLDSRSRSRVGEGGMASIISGAASGLSLSSRCGVVRPGASSNSSTATLAMSPCKQFAAFVCERGGMSSAPEMPSISVKQAAAPAASADPIPPGAVSYQGCYTLVDGQQQRAAASSLALAATPLPVLLSQNVSTLAQCYSLTRQAGLAFYSIVGGSACWGGAAVPGLPFVNVSDDSACRQSCSRDAGSSSSSHQQPGCAAAGYAAVFALMGAATPTNTAAHSAAAVTPYLCLTEQQLAAPNATIMGQLHISLSQLALCEALCSSLAACDLYTYDLRAGACVLLGVPGVATLASLPVYDAQWAQATCVKAARLVEGAVPRQLPSVSYAAFGAATHVCSAALGSRVRAAPVVSYTPQDGLLVSDLAACAASCNANATCQGFAVWPTPGSSNGSLLCGTRTGLVVDTSYDWLASRPWVELPDASDNDTSGGVEGCLVLPRLVTPPAYMCTEYVDAAGWELRRLDSSDEQSCRAACDADDDCSLYVVYYSSPPSCSLRFRPFHDTKAWPGILGTNGRIFSTGVGVMKSCLHTHRLLTPLLSPVLGNGNRRVRLGEDDAWHLCTPHLDMRGDDMFRFDTFKDVVCAQECTIRSGCSYFITTADAPDGACYAKSSPLPFTLGNDNEYPNSRGMTRLDLGSVLETCLYLERQLPRSPPAYVCAQQYSAVLPAGARNTSVATAYACEALCDAGAGCVGYTWMAHNSTCVLASSSSIRPGDTTNRTGGLLARTTGPSWLATQTCLHAPRLMAAALPADISSQQPAAAGQHVHAAGAWHFCVPAAAWSAGAPDLLGAAALPNAGNSSANYTAVRACSLACASTTGCQLFSLSWRNVTDASPSCVLRGWSSVAAMAGPGLSQAADPLALTCLVLASERAFPTAAGGLAHPRVRPAAVQAYRNKQYSVYLQPASYSLAAATCQSAGAGGGQLLSVNSAQELTVVQALLRPYLQVRMHPAAGVAQLDTTPFWTGLVWDGTINGSSNPSNGGCSGWCYSHGRTTDTSFVSSVLQAGSAAAGCGALDLIGGAPGLRAANCTAWLLPFVCEQQMPAVFVDGITSFAQPLQVFPAQAGYSQALQLASAAGAVLAVVDLTGATARSGRRHARALLQGSAAVRFGSVSAAASACGLPQLRSSGCWVQLQPPTNACNSTSSSGSTAALCGATALLLTDAASSAASTLNSLAGLSAGSSTCAAALVDSSGSFGSQSFVRAPCSTQAAFLAAVVDPDAPLRAATQLTQQPQVPSPDVGFPSSPAGGSISPGAIAGIAVGAALVALALIASVVALARRRKATGDGSPVPPVDPAPVCLVKLSAQSARAPSPVSTPPSSRPPHTSRSRAADASRVLSHEQNVDADAMAAELDSPSVQLPPTPGGSVHRASQVPSRFATQTITFGLDSTTGDVHGSSNQSLRGLAISQQALNTQIVTAEDPDQDDVTWRINPKTDVTWDTKAELGKGTFGVVYKGVYKGLPVAVKTVLRAGQGAFELQSLKSLLHEARILAKLRHPNIVTCYGGCITNADVFIVEELMSSNLSQFITSAAGVPIPLDTVLRIAMDVASGLFQLHPTIVHRDLKPDNVLLDAAGRAKISDFGLARFKMQSYLVSTKNFAAGTIPYMPPETFNSTVVGISEKADIYSLAIIIWALLWGQLQPWTDYHYAAIMFKVSVQGERPPLPEDPARCPPRLASLLARMWAQEPAARPGAGDVLKQLGVVLRDVTRAAAGSAAASRCNSGLRSGGPTSAEAAPSAPFAPADLP